MTVESTAHPKCYLQVCKEELEGDLLGDYLRKSTLWKVAAISTVVVVSILATAGFIATAIYAPVFVPIAGISSLLLISQITRVYQLFDEWSDKAAQRADQLSQTYHNYQNLEGYTPEQIQNLLQQKGIQQVTGMRHNDPQLTTLKPLLARVQFWENHIAKIEEVRQKHLSESNELLSEGLEENRDFIYQLQSETLELERQILESKIKNAFIHAVIQRPHFEGTLEDLGTFSLLSGQERAIAMQTGASQAASLFTFSNTSSQPLQYEEVKRLAIPALSARLLAVMPN